MRRAALAVAAAVATAAVAATAAAGCTRTATHETAPRLEPLGGLDAAFAGARGHRRILALVSPN